MLLALLAPADPAASAVWPWAVLVAGVLVAAGLVVGLALRRERRLREEVASWTQVFDHLQLAVVRSDPQGRVTGWNPAATRTLGHPAEEMIGASIDLLEPHEGAGLRAGLEQALAHGQWAGEMAARHGDGSRVQCDSVIMALRGEGGVVREVIGLHRDVTQARAEQASRRRLEEQLRQSQKMEAVGQLAGGVAHDFNNLLTSILGYAELLGRHFEHGSEELEDLAELQKAGRRAAALTRQLLAFSRHQPARTSAVDLVTIVDGLAQLLGPALGEGMRLEVAHGVDTAWVLADRTQIEQVVMNLALNARDAMPRGGALSLTTSRVHLPVEELAGPRELPTGEYVRLLVADEGRGMDEDTRARVFDPFFTTKEPGKGTGLGLSTVYAIVQRCGGAISVDSEPGQGTRFSVLLPRVEPPAADSAPVARQPVSSGNATILVVEDEPLVRRLLCSGLREAGYVVLEACSGVEARRVADAHAGRIALLVTDVVMPGEGGVEVAESLLARRPELQVLYISGYTEDAIVAHGVPAQGASFLQKPFTPAALQACIQALLSGDPSARPLVQVTRAGSGAGWTTLGP